MINTLAENSQSSLVKSPATPSMTTCGGDCCNTSSDGNPTCSLPARDTLVSLPTNTTKAGWRKLRSSVMFIVACVFSPCCTPLLVPVALALLAGTPLAVWAGAHLGWVYGGLTGISVISLVLGIRWLRRSRA